MSLRVYVDGYSGFKANERPRQFTLDDVWYTVDAVEDRWYSPEAMYFRVRSGEKRFVLRYDEREDEWRLESAFDGAELFLRPTIELFTLDDEVAREAVRRIAGCEACDEMAQIPFDFVLDKITRRDPGVVEYVLTSPLFCPRCGDPITEKTLVMPDQM